jgi:hypothetical protein
MRLACTFINLNQICYERGSTSFQARQPISFDISLEEKHRGSSLELTDCLPNSFGDPNAQPPTPKQTPTSSIFPSPVFETPKHNQGRFDESPNAWTPRFAEEYSVFNTTPGNLRGTQGSFPDFGPSTPYIQQSEQPPSAGQKRPFSAEGIAAEIATHVNHFSPTPNLPLPPVEPSQRLQSTEFGQSTDSECHQPSSSQERSAKKQRRNTEVEDGGEEQGQTVTPPPSARKRERKLAPKLDPSTMQSDQGFGQQDYIDGATQQQHHNMGSYVTTPSDMFGYPLSAGPLSGQTPGQVFGSERGFWDPNTSMGGMELDFSGAASADVFQTQGAAHHGTMQPLDWAGANQMFHQADAVSQQNQGNMQAHPNDERALASKAIMPRLDTVSEGQSTFTGTYSTPVDDPFGISGNVGGVNPGLLFSRPPSSSLTSIAFSQAAMQQSASAQSVPQSNMIQEQATPKPQSKAAAQRGELRRSMSSKELGPSERVDRSFASSPTKASGRPGLSRSFSESRGKKPAGRAPLPALAPAPRPQQAGIPANRPVISQPSRHSGRTSPMKSDHHHRLSSLSSIPETAGMGPRTRTQAKFTIDANGRAKVETTVIVDDELPPPLSVRKRHSAQPALRHRQWHSSDSEDDSSSTDDEPIIIPSRNNSFVLPDPLQATRTNPLHNSQRSISERSTSSHATFGGASLHDDDDSEAETVMNDMTPTGGRVGDAASELKKLRENRHKQQLPSPTKHKRYASVGGAPLAEFVGSSYSSHAIISPTSMTDSSLPTPSSSRSHGIRCLCNRPEVDRDGDGFMVQWYESSLPAIAL